MPAPKNKVSSCRLSRYLFLFCLVFLLVYIFMSGFFFTHGEVDLSILKSLHLRMEENNRNKDESIILSTLNQAVDRGSNIHINQPPVVAEKSKLLHSTEVKTIEIIAGSTGSKDVMQSHKAQTYFTKNSTTKDFLNSNYVFSLDKILSQPQDCVGHSTDLVLGVAVNTNEKIFAIFAYSFREVNPTAMAIIFVNEPVPKIHSEIARNASIIIVEFNGGHMKPEFLANFHPSSQRWVLFERLLSASDGYLARVAKKLIVVDVRDTYFQTDPFALFDGTKNVFYAFGESRGMNIFSCEIKHLQLWLGWNTGWIRDCFPGEVLDRIGTQPIICSGISIGSMDKMFEYITLMSTILQGRSGLTNKFPQCERNGVDQGVHNMIIHTKQLSPVTVKYPDTFRVINMQSSPEFVPVSEISTELRKSDNSLFSIVHQYDRVMTFQRALARKYVRWVNIGNPEEEWAADPLCSRFSKEKNVEIFRGICDMGATRLLSPASCCETCVRSRNISKLENGVTVYKSCNGFTYLDGVCYLKGCTVEQMRRAISNFRQNRKDIFYSSPGGTCAYIKEQFLLLS